MPVNDSVHSPSAFESDPDFKPLEVKLLTLDKFAAFKDDRRIKLMKIDVEGYEPNVFEGMRRILSEARVENIFCEFNSGWLKRNNNFTSAMLFEKVTSLGLGVYKMTELQVHPERNGDPFELQDMWLKPVP